LRVERAARRSPAFATAWRAGELSFLQAASLVPLIHAELPETSVVAWTRRARGFSLRRLRDDVEAALESRECDPGAWLACGGLPDSPEAGRSEFDPEPITPALSEREIGEKNRGSDRDPQRARAAESESETVAQSSSASAAPDRESCRVSLIVESEVAQLFRALHCSVRRRLEREVGRAVTKGEALGWICAHAHHVVYRAQGGGDERENLVTLCAYHHLRGVHGGTLRIRGRAPHALRFELGLRAGRAPLAVYASGDRRLRAVSAHGTAPCSSDRSSAAGPRLQRAARLHRDAAARAITEHQPVA
jgi:hypothetical protein